jgi:hypothetical protein
MKSHGCRFLTSPGDSLLRLVQARNFAYRLFRWLMNSHTLNERVQSSPLLAAALAESEPGHPRPAAMQPSASGNPPLPDGLGDVGTGARLESERDGNVAPIDFSARLDDTEEADRPRVGADGIEFWLASACPTAKDARPLTLRAWMTISIQPVPRTALIVLCPAMRQAQLNVRTGFVRHAEWSCCRHSRHRAGSFIGSDPCAARAERAYALVDCGGCLGDRGGRLELSWLLAPHPFTGPFIPAHCLVVRLQRREYGSPDDGEQDQETHKGSNDDKQCFHFGFLSTGQSKANGPTTRPR